MPKRIDLLKEGSRLLSKEGVANSSREAEIFLSQLLNCSRINLYLDNQIVKKEDSRSFWNLLQARARGLPLQYLLGSTEFMGIEFKIRPGVFIPRPETEILVETVLKLSAFSFQLSANILDIGTGCGNIAISIAKYVRNAHIFACDISDSALQLTKENSRLHKTNIHLIKSNLFSAFKNEARFSLIVSNPPYIETRELPHLAQELHHEPTVAYDGGPDGLFYCRKIIEHAPDYLQNEGLLVLEIADNQAIAVRKIIVQSKKFSLLKIVKDYNGIDRVIVASKQKLG